MEHKRILELALIALQNQKAQVEAEIEALRAEMRGSVRATSTRRAGPTAGPKGKRRAKTPAEREAQSKRMKAYWAAKKAAVAAKAKRATRSRPKARSKSAEWRARREDGSLVQPVRKRNDNTASEQYKNAFDKRINVEGGQKWMASKDGGITRLWSPDGRQIYFLQSCKLLMAVDVSTGAEFLARTPRVLFDFDKPRYWWGDNYTMPNWDISPDGKYFVVTRDPKDWKLPRQINVTTNFLEVLGEQVPTK
jgi:hypothetical protein